MRYRETGQHCHFNHTSIDTYDANDKDLMRDCMTTKRFSRPKGVWQANLNAFITIEMDAESRRIRDILTSACQNDSVRFVMHVQGQNMAFYRSQSHERELFLTENAYSIFEGSQSLTESDEHTEHGTFAAINSHLVVISRSHFVRKYLEDEEYEQQRLFSVDDPLLLRDILTIDKHTMDS